MPMNVDWIQGIRSRFVLPVILVMLGCGSDDRVAGGTGVGNPPAGEVVIRVEALAPVAAKLSAKETVESRMLRMVDSGGTVFHLSEAYLHVARIRLYLPDEYDCTAVTEEDCEVDEKVVLNQSVIFDLMSGISQPSLQSLTVPTGSYNRMEIRVEDLDETPYPGIPTALEGKTLFLSGLFSYGGRDDRKFTILVDFNEDIEVVAGNELFVPANSTTFMRMGFAVAEWLGALDIGRCLDQGELVLDSEGNLFADDILDCDDFEETLKRAIRGSTELDEVDEPN